MLLAWETAPSTPLHTNTHAYPSLSPPPTLLSPQHDPLFCGPPATSRFVFSTPAPAVQAWRIGRPSVMAFLKAAFLYTFLLSLPFAIVDTMAHSFLALPKDGGHGD